MLTGEQVNGQTRHVRVHPYWHKKIRLESVYAGISIPELLDWILADHYKEKYQYKLRNERYYNRTPQDQFQ